MLMACQTIVNNFEAHILVSVLLSWKIYTMKQETLLKQGISPCIPYCLEKYYAWCYSNERHVTSIMVVPFTVETLRLAGHTRKNEMKNTLQSGSQKGAFPP